MLRYRATFWSLPLSLLGAFSVACALPQGPERPEPSAKDVAVAAPSEPAPAVPDAAPAPARVGISSAQLAGPPLAWSFRSAAPVASPPALVPGGGVVVTTVEGYVHRLRGDGHFEWSYTLTGNPIGGASVDRQGRVYVATSAERVYALESTGRKRWVFDSLVSLATPVLWAPPGVVYFVGEDRRLYTLSARTGALLWHRPLEHSTSGDLSLTPRGNVAVATRAPEVWLIRDAVRGQRVSVPGELAQPPLFAHDHWFAQGADELLAFDKDGQTVVWRSAGQRAGVNAAGNALVLERAGSLVWLAPDTGRVLHQLDLPMAASAPPALTDEGVALVPTVSGVLLVLQPEPRDVVPVRISWAPLRTPIYDPVARQAVVTGGDGVITAVDIGHWLDRRDGA
jgi:outer membrane protein assembly factor BamB